MKYISSICCMLGAVAFGADADSQDGPTVDPSAVTIAKTAIELTVSVDGTASFSLPSNATTGYSWQLYTQLGDDAIVSVEFDPNGGEVKKDKDGQPLCGAPGETLVTVKGLREGETSITIIYARPWEKDKAPVDTRTIFVTVTK